MADPWKNILYYGDNLGVLRLHLSARTIDLVYLDPPFNSNATYNVLFAEQNGSRAASQIKAFGDTWRWDTVAAETYQQTVEGGGRVAEALVAFRAFLGESNMMAYLVMMAPRLVELRRVLKPTGSLYLHCDPTAGHYLKMLLDAVFGPENFRNEIVWYYYNKIHDRRKRLFPNATDSIFLYVKDSRSSFTFNQLKEQRPVPVRQLARKKVAGRMVNVKGEDGHVVYRMKADRTIDNVWRLPCLQPAAKERLGYQTQKPESVLERIVKASSKEGDLILDPFCGCGTTISVAQRLKRRWIGIDITHLAIGLIKHRLRDAFGEEILRTYQTIGEPTSIPDAQTLAVEDPYQFQWWALGLVGARPVEQKKGSDKGIDGRLYFHDEAEGAKTKQIVLSVKAGRTSVAHLRDLRGVMDREHADIGVLLTMQEPTAPMRAEAASCGFYHSPWWNKEYPRLQVLTVAELLAGKGIAMPPIRHVSTTFQQAPRAKGESEETAPLPFHQEESPGEESLESEE